LTWTVRMSLPDRLLDRFFDTLLEEIREHHPAYLRASFTVAEIYQNLVPYRTHRDRIGAEINGDYEDALLRLLAGEGDFLELESEPARKRIQDELRGANPNTTIYREFAAAEVRLNRARVRMMDAQESGGASRTGQGRVAVGLTPEEAREVVPRPGGEAGVNPDLGLFVADLFGAPPSVAAAPSSAPVAPLRPQSGTTPLPAAPVAGVPPEEAPRVVSPPVQPQMEAPSPPAVQERQGGGLPTPSSDSAPGVATGGGISAVAPSPAPHPDRGRQAGAFTSTPSPLSRPDGIEEENHRLRRIVADQALEIQRLRELLAQG